MSNEGKLSNTINQIAVGDFATDLTLTSPTAAGRLFRGVAPAEFQMIFEGVLASGGARQSAKIDFGASRGLQYLMRTTLEFAATTSMANNAVDFFIAWSSSATPASGNLANTTGSDASYTDETGLLAQATRIGSLTTDDNTVIQSGEVGIFVPKLQFGNLIMVNNTAQNIAASPGDECHVVMDAIDLGN